MKEFLTPGSLASQVRMARSQFAGVFLLVEGDTDARVYKNVVDKSVQVVTAHNKDKAVKALEILVRDSFRGVMAIVDADFSLLDKAPRKIRKPNQAALQAVKKAAAQQRGKKHCRVYFTAKNLCHTDGHDLEIMMIRSPALEKVLGEFVSDEKISAFEKSQKKNLRERLLESATPLGYLRWHSLRELLNLRFEGLGFGKFIEEKTLLPNTKEMLVAVKNQSTRHDLKNEELLASLNALQKPSHDPWHVCCGHDVLEVLSIALKKTIGSHDAGKVKRELLEMNLRLAFERAHFTKTKLYRALLRWQRSHPGFVLVSR